MASSNSSIWSRFDEICVLSCTKYLSRMRTLTPRLNAVGIRDFSVHMNFDNPFEKFLLNNLNTASFSPNVMSCLMGTYAIIKTAYETGVESLLLLEDDVAFAKDTDMIGEAIESIPDDCDVAKLEWFFGCAENGSTNTDELFARPKHGGHWVNLDRHIIVGTGATAYNRKAMQFAIMWVEAGLRGKKIHPLDMWMRPGGKPKFINLYGAVPLVAVQSPVKESMNKCVKAYDERLFAKDGYIVGRDR